MNTEGNNANILALAEFVIADGREGIIIGRTEIGPQHHLVQFEADDNQWFPADKVRLDRLAASRESPLARAGFLRLHGRV